MRRFSIFLGIFLVFVFFWFFNNLFLSFTGKSITDLILTDNLDASKNKGVDENREVPSSIVEGREKTCVDSDSGKDFFILGSIRGYDSHGDFYTLNDSCKGNNLTEYFCKEISIMYVLYPCPEKCLNGECVLNTEAGRFNETNQTNENLSCRDTDGGLNYFFKGNCNDSFGSLEDACAIGGNNGWFLKESYCEEGTCLFLNYDCLEGCSEGKCLGQAGTNEENVFLSPENEEQGGINCVDSDEKDLYKKGIVRAFFDAGEKSFEDECLLLMGEDKEPIKVKNCQGEECFVKEGACSKDGLSLIEDYPCPKGCVDGICFKDSSFFNRIAEFFRNLF